MGFDSSVFRQDSTCGYDVMVTYNFAKVDSRVRFSLPAPIICTGDRAANVADCKSVKSWVRVPPCAPNNGVLSVVACTLVCDPGSMSSILIEHPNLCLGSLMVEPRCYIPSMTVRFCNEVPNNTALPAGNIVLR